MLIDHEDAMFACIVGKICDKIKQQPCIVAAYRLLERQVYFKYLINIKCDGPAVRCMLIKILSYML